ncbi:MAG: translocation/assembly module TamB domain-containing protein [Selenomonadaceae bacterium]|nr:translocation/assembly module TamB domain-containing protein [Selenomonadaceae bacterium]
MWKVLKILGGALIILALGGGLYINSKRTEIIENALATVEETASKALGVPVKIGNVDLDKINLLELDKNSDIVIHDIEIFDKNSELIAKVDKAEVNFKLLALRDDPVAALDEIKLDGALLNLKKRDENSWNVNDIKLESEGESTFDAKISLERGTINADFDGKKISVEEISGEADCANMNAIETKINAKTLGAQINATGTLGKEQQVINAKVDNIFFDKVLPFLPEDKIPEGVEILRGSAEKTSIHLLRKGDALSYLGSTVVKGAAVKVEKTDVENIFGTVTFNENEIIIDGSATANGQHAAASGKIYLDTDETFFDIYAESAGFTPSAIISDIGIKGAADVRAHLIGTAKNPQVNADIYSDWLAYENYSAQNISTKLRYVGEMIYLNDTSLNILGGNVTGTAEIRTSDLTFNANVKANGLDAATLCDFAGSENVINGIISADLGINGGGDKPVKVYGNAKANTLDFEDFRINEANASFYFAENNLTIDYLSANLPNNGTLGLEGKITDMSNLALNFYGAHVDMAIAKKFNSALDLSGLADFKGAVIGDASNPNVTLELSAVDRSEDSEHFIGKIFKQPYDSIRLMVSGSLDGVHIDDFVLEKDGDIKWKVIEGKVGLTGNKNVNIQLDTTEVRAEDIAALVAPDQEITGNVTNTVKITGTIDNPQVAGNIKFNRGSYRGVLLSGMTGDYFLDGDIVRLQDFEITSPMVDMILNGTINKNTQVMDFVVEGKDINLQRFKSKLPEKYNAEGHIKFEGLIKGTPDIPIFEGELTSDEILLNGIALTNVYGHVETNGANVYLTDFHLRDGDANCQMMLSMNLDSETVSGEAEVTDANIANMFTIADVNNELLDGKLNSKILIGGTLTKLHGSLEGDIPQGTFAGYDIHDIKVAINLLNNSVYINQLEGKQGDKGTINMHGSANLNGPLDMTLTAKDLELGIFSKAAGLDLEMVGTSNIVAKLGGTIYDPFGELLLTATGNIKGSTFDLLHGHFLLKDWRVNVEELTVQRELAGKTYGASMEGFIPLKALLARSKENLPDNEQLNLTVSLDGADLSLLPVMNKMIKFGVGELGGSVKITGTAAHPQFNGQIAMNDGSIKLKGMKSLIEHINVSMLFKGERFDIENFSGNIGSGTFALTGGFNFPGLEFQDYNFDFAANALDIDSDYFDGIFNANFNFSEAKLRKWTMPKLSGQINLDKCRISVPTIPDSDDPLPDILLDVGLNLGEKVHFYSSHLYDMYFTGNANFEGTTLHPKTSGTINVKRGGTLTYLETVFNIRECEVYFNQIDSFLPTLRFAADTKISNVKIFLNAHGQPGNMEFKLTSSPEMTQEEIAKLLTLREAYSRGGEVTLTTEDALAIGLQMTLLGDLEDALKKTLGIDQFTVSRGSGSMFERHTTGEQSKGDRDKDYNVKIGKYINDKLMLRYTRGFGSHKVNRYGIQYDFNDNLGFTIEREGKDYIFSIEARYKF